MSSKTTIREETPATWKQTVITASSETISSMSEEERSILDQRLDTLAYVRFLPSVDGSVRDLIDKTADDLAFNDPQANESFDDLYVTLKFNPEAWKVYKRMQASSHLSEMTAAEWSLLDMRINSLATFRSMSSADPATLDDIDTVVKGLINKKSQAKADFDKLSIRFSNASSKKTE